MKALYSVGTNVPFARVMRDYRAALLPVGILLAINIVVLIAVVLPLSNRVSAEERRVDEKMRERQLAEAGLKQAEAMRDGKAKATTDLDMFYKQMLPTSVSVASRITELKIQLLAKKHDVTYQRTTATTQCIRESALEQMSLSMRLTGEYEDVRALLYELETSPEFVVIDKVDLAEGLSSNAPLSFSLEVSTFYRVPKNGPSGKDGC
jgi:Tfp pilus assembly protein PilO